MATENQNNSSTDETSGQEQQGQQQENQAPETGTENQQQTEQVKIDDSTKLPETHPLVKAYRATLEENRKNSVSATELAEARAQAKKVTDLEKQLGERPTTEALETLQTRYDRLESFLQSVGGPISKALDSRTFTRDLFESDKDVKDLVKEFNKANPSATSTALGSSGARPSGTTVEVNDLLRAAARK